MALSGMRTESSSAFEKAGLWVIGAFLGATVVVWAGASLSLRVSGQPVGVSLADAGAATVSLPSHLGDPAGAWPESVRRSIPGTGVYWSCTLVVAAILFAVGVVGVIVWNRRWRFGQEPRERLGVDTQAKLARPRALAPLAVDGDVPGRFLLGRVDRQLVATENRTAPTVGGPLRARRASARQGDRGAVALLGPSRCGKTTAAISGILCWDGPVVLSSVKNDLLEHTIKWRAQLGEVKVFSPTRAKSATWSPLRAAKSMSGARAAARSLCDAAPRAGIDGGGDFWFTHVEVLLSALLWLAANDKGCSMEHVCEWVMTQDRPLEDSRGDVEPRVQRLLASPDRATADGARRAANALIGIWQNDDRLRGSIYTTATTAVWPWTDSSVSASAKGCDITLDWLLSGNNTLYLCGPLQDQRRFAPVFGGLIGDLVDQVYERADRTNKSLDPTLLVVLDEAANTPLRQLPEWASTVAGHGVQLVTVWQSKAQLDAIYGEKPADTILTNHLTKLGFAGLSDRSSLDYFSYLLGDEQVASRSLSTDARGADGRSVSENTSAAALAPAHVLRQQQPGHAVMVHGTLPPAHLRSVSFFKDRRLRARSDGTASPK